MSNQFLQAKKVMPTIGVGLGLRRELANETFASADKIDWLELVPENYMGLGGEARTRLEQAKSRFPLVTHGINLSLGSTDDLSQVYLTTIKKFLDDIDAPWWSDHVCFSSHNGVYLHDLLPLPLNKETLAHVANRIKIAQETVGRPFLIENISYYMTVPDSTMTEFEFLGELLEKADCGLLLDVNNVYVNAQNHGFDPLKAIISLPLERVVQMHVAGHTNSDGVLLDTHGAPVIEPVFDLLKEVLPRTEVKAVMLERDQNYPEFAELMDELERIREIVKEKQPALLNKKEFALKQAAPSNSTGDTASAVAS